MPLSARRSLAMIASPGSFFTAIVLFLSFFFFFFFFSFVSPALLSFAFSSSLAKHRTSHIVLWTCHSRQTDELVLVVIDLSATSSSNDGYSLIISFIYSVASFQKIGVETAEKVCLEKTRLVTQTATRIIITVTSSTLALFIRRNSSSSSSSFISSVSILLLCSK